MGVEQEENNNKTKKQKTNTSFLLPFSMSCKIELRGYLIRH